MFTGILFSGAIAPLEPVAEAWFSQHWHERNAALQNRPPVGGPNGIAPENINDRLFQAFGSTEWPEPLMAVDGPINGAKGNIFKGRRTGRSARVNYPGQPVSINKIKTKAREAVAADTTDAADDLLTQLFIVCMSAPPVHTLRLNILL